jgi:hypothetical protein
MSGLNATVAAFGNAGHAAKAASTKKIADLAARMGFSSKG